MDARDVTMGMLADWDRAELETFISQQEAPLIEELAEFESDQLAMSAADIRERKLAIKAARLELEGLRTLWLKLHRDPDAGPNQTLGAARAVSS